MSRHHDPIIDTPQRPHRQHAGHTAVDIPSLGDSPAARPPAANASPPRRLLSMGALSNATTARTVARSPSGHPCLVAMDTLQREISALNTQMQRVGNALVNLNKIRAQQSTTPVPTPNMVFKSCGGLLHCIATVSGELHAERWQRVESAARRWGEHDSTMDVVTVLDLAMCAAMTTLGELAADVSTKVCGVGQPLPIDASIVTGHRTVAEAPPPLRRVSSEAHHEQQRREPFTTPLQSPRRASSQSRASTVSTNAADPSTRPARPALSPATRPPTAHPPAHPQTPTVTPEVSPQVTPTGHKAAQVPLSPFKAASREVAFEALPPRVADPAITQPPRRRTSSDADDTSTAFVRQLSAPKPLQKTTSLSRLQRLREMGIGALGRSIDNGAADSVVCPGS